MNEKDTESIKKKMEDLGVEWTNSDKKAGSRVNGLQLVRDRLKATESNEEPGLYFMDNCRACLATLPVLPRDAKNEDDIDTDSEDHIYDDVRYRVLAGTNRQATELVIVLPT